MAQLGEWLLSIPDVCSSNRVIGKILYITCFNANFRNDENKLQRGRSENNSHGKTFHTFMHLSSYITNLGLSKLLNEWQSKWQYFWLDYWWTLNNLFPLKPRPQGLHKTQWERDFSNSLRFCMRKKWCTLHCVLRRKLHRAERAFRFFPGPKWSITWTLWWTHNWIETGGSRLTGGTCRTRDSRPHSQTRWRTKT